MGFQKGNAFGRGRPRGARNKGSAELAAAARAVLTEHFDATVEKLLRSRNELVVLQTLKWLADRGYGKAPISPDAGGIDPDSPQGVFMTIANQPIPMRPPKPAST